MPADKPPEKSKLWKWLKALSELPVLNLIKPLISLGEHEDQEAQAKALREVHEKLTEVHAQLQTHGQTVIAELQAQGVADVTPAEVERQVELMAYRGCLLRMPEYQYVESAGIASLERAVTLRLEEAYVDLEFLPRERSVGPEREERELVERLERGEFEEGEKEAAERRLAEMSIRFRLEEQRLSLAEVLRNRQVVVLGDPGSGKTTLVRYLTQTYALGPDTVRERLGMEEDLVPIVIAAARFASALRERPRLHLWDFIQQEVAALGCQEAGEGFVLAEMQAGRAIILIDGLDEIPEAEERIAVAKCVGELLAQCPDCRFVITSRIIGYGLSRVAGPEHVELAPFSDGQVREFARKWWRAFEHSRHPEAPDYAAAEREAETLADTIFSSPRVLDLARNPLMIALTAIVQHQEGSLPDRRVELYDKALRMLVETWNKRRSLSAVQLAIPEGAKLDYYDFCEVWAPIAFWMHETQPTAGVHTVDLRKRLVEHLGGRVLDGKTAEATADSYIDAASRHTGLLRERGADRWSFFHQTFQEYLAAQEFARLVAVTPSVLSRATDPRWREVTRLAVGYVGVIQRNSRGAEEVLNTLLATGDVLCGDAESLERHTYRHLLLVAGCIADQPRVSSRLENEVVGRLLDACQAAEYDIAHEAFCEALEAMDHVRPLGEVVERCRGLLGGSPSWRVRASAAALLGRGPCEESSMEVLIARLGDLDGDVESACAEALSRFVSRSDWPRVVQACRDDARACWGVGATLARTATRGDWDLLVELAHDPSPWVRIAAAHGLRAIAVREDWQLLLPLVPDGTAGVMIAWALACTATRQHWDSLADVARQNSDARHAVAEGLGGLATGGDWDRLVALAGDENAGVRFAATTVLGRIATRDDRDVLVRLAGDPNSDVRSAAATALGETYGHDDLRFLKDLGGNESVRLGVALALARIGTRDDLSVLQTLAHDQAWRVRYTATHALARIGTREDLPLLKTLAKDENQSVRHAAAEALGRIVTRDDLPLLQELAKGGDWSLRWMAARGLSKVLTAEQLRGMYEAETEKDAKEAYFEAMWYAVHGQA